MDLVTTARQAWPRAEPLGKGRQDQEQSQWSLVVWGFFARVSALQPQVWTRLCPPDTEVGAQVLGLVKSSVSACKPLHAW